MMKRAANKQREKFRVTLPGYLQDLASAIRVGRSLVAALTVVAESAEEPTKSELERAITDEALGRPLDASLEAVAVRMEAPDLDQVALVAALNRRSGSNVAEALDRVSEGARERQDLKREVQALTSQAKMSSWVLTALPGVLLLMLSLVSPRYASPLFHTTAGVVLCFVGAAMVFAGWKALKKITDVRI
jgi:tight adherence protein B